MNSPVLSQLKQPRHRRACTPNLRIFLANERSRLYEASCTAVSLMGKYSDHCMVRPKNHNHAGFAHLPLDIPVSSPKAIPVASTASSVAQEENFRQRLRPQLEHAPPGQ
eukprot:TRINITY_DN19728_c0_g1_i4.p1 TRINITY_DN19728_c0_g1~~TRINITY_DN19728_c0_g1_i4.p1  ORF type:complete len:109 (+),score=8.02 TRINITY_DN19728_c0_g1_i4:431-757(+)